MTQHAVVRVTGLNLRKSLATGAVVKVLRRSSHLEILGEQTWYRVRTRDGLEGFVFADLVEKEPAEVADAVQADAESPGSVCVLQQYEDPRFVGNPVTADLDFFPMLDRLKSFAEQCDLFIHVNSSARDPGRNVSGAIVTPAKRSNHLVGHALDFNLKSETGAFFNSSKLRALDQQPEPVRRFIQLIRDDPILRWGGDFATPDVVHVDDQLNGRFPEIWDAKLASR